MGKFYQNQHYISQVLQRRFTVSGKFHKCAVQVNKWKIGGPGGTFSYEGYTQMLSGGKVDDSLEEVFKQVEDELPQTLHALDHAVKNPVNELPEKIYKNFCWYCAFLICLSPLFKTLCISKFLKDLHEELQHGKGDLLDNYIKMTQDDIARYREAIAKGFKIIIVSRNYRQLLFRIQFIRQCREYYDIFRFRTKWAVCKSPVNLPLSDNAVISLPENDLVGFGLPISPEILLRGVVATGISFGSVNTYVDGITLPPEMAERWVDLICGSAMLTLISKVKIDDIVARRSRIFDLRTPQMNYPFTKWVIEAGKNDFNSGFDFKIISNEEYEKFLLTVAIA